MSNADLPAPPPVMQENKKSNFALYLGIGCLGMVVLAVICVAIIGFGVQYAITSTVEAYTDDTPIEIPQVEISMADFDALSARVDEFKRATEVGDSDTPLVLSADDINAIMQRHPDWDGVGEYAYVSIDGETVSATVSIPVDTLMEGFMEGKYMNGSAGFNVLLRNGRLFVMLDTLTVKGNPIPDQFMTEIRKENLAKDIVNDPEVADTLARLESIEVADGVITLTPRKTADAGGAE
jgi:hypothetical protein